MRELIDKYRLGAKRRRLLRRGLEKEVQLKSIIDQTDKIKPNDIILVSTCHDEATRLPYFLKYYRKLGVGHFLMIDNRSTDKTKNLLKKQPDVSLWYTNKSYKGARFGVDWVNALLNRYCSGHWILSVDPDEFLVFPHMETRPLHAMTDWMDQRQKRSFGTVLLDMYPRKPLSEAIYKTGTNPLNTAPFFDGSNYIKRINAYSKNLWVQGGVRQRVFFADDPRAAPALNKIPLVKWQKGQVYVSSAHTLLPRILNVTYSHSTKPQICGVLLHFKFNNLILPKIEEELQRKQHYAGSREYKAYANHGNDVHLWTKSSTKYENWQQLEELGLMSRGDWI